MTNKKFPYLWIAVALLIIAGLIWYIFHLKTDTRIDKAKTEQKSIEKKIDSLDTKRAEVIGTVLTNSRTNAVRANNLKKSLPNEETIIRDTTFAAMCEYITNYRPE